MSHHPQCDWHCDQYEFECVCGESRPRAEWFEAAYPTPADGASRASTTEPDRAPGTTNTKEPTQ